MRQRFGGASPTQPNGVYIDKNGMRRRTLLPASAARSSAFGAQSVGASRFGKLLG